jgi:hypothetical protein
MSGWSRSFLNPSLVSALEAGRSFEEWLGGRIPGVDYARISADQSTRSAVLAKGREAGTGIRHPSCRFRPDGPAVPRLTPDCCGSGARHELTGHGGVAVLAYEDGEDGEHPARHSAARAM